MTTRVAPGLAEALDSLPLPFSLFDSRQRLVFCNKALMADAGLDPRSVRSGMPLLDLARLIAFRGGYGAGDPERLAEEQARIDRRLVTRRIVRTISGRSIEHHSVPTPDGGFATIAADVTGFVLAQGEAASQAHRLLGLLSRAHTGIALFDAHGRLVIRNHAFDALIGAPPGLLRDDTTLSGMVAALNERGEYALVGPDRPSEILKADRRQVLRSRRRRPNGSEIELVSTPEAQGGFLIEVTDITALAHAEAEAQRRAGLLQGVIDALPHGIALFDVEARLLAHNAPSEALSGLDPRSAEASGLLRRVQEQPAVETPFAGTALAPQGAAGDALRGTVRNGRREVRPDGTVIETVASPMPGGGWVVCMTDVTPLVAAETEARQRAAQQQLMLETIRHGLGLFDREHRLVLGNPLFAELLALPEEALRPGTPLIEILRAQAAAGQFGGTEESDQLLRVGRLLDRRRPQRYRRVRPNGTVLDFASDPAPDCGFVVTITDVTARLRAEQEAASRAAQQQVVLDTMRQGILLYGPDRRLVLANSLAAELAGVPPEALRPGATVDEVVRAQAEAGEFGSEAAGREAIERSMRRDFTRPQRYRRVRGNGTVIDFTTDPTPDGGFVATATDVTARVRAEQEAERRAAQQQVTLDTTRHGVALFDAEGRLVLANALAADLAGVPRSAMTPGATVADLVAAQIAVGEFATPEEEALALAHAREHALRRDTRQPHRHTRTRANGMVLDYASDPTPDGGFVVTITDVTARVRAEEEARREASIRAVMLETMRHGIVLYDGEQRIIAANRLAAELCGTPDGVLVPGRSLEEVLRAEAASGEFGPPEQAEAMIRRALSTNGRERQRLTRTRPNGMVLEFIFEPALEAGFVVTITDVTARVRVEAEAKRQAALAGTVLATMRHGIVLFDAGARLVLANHLLAELLGIPQDALAPGVSAEAILMAEAATGQFGSPDEAAAEARRILALDRSKPLHYLRRRADGRTLECLSEPTAEGGYVVTVTDVTDRIAAEQRASDQAARLRVMIDALRRGVALYDREGRLISANAEAERLFGLPGGTMRPGLTQREIARLQAASGEFGPPEDAARTLAEKDALDRSRPQRYLRRRPDGTMLEVLSDPTPDGGFVVTLSDITEMLRERETADRHARQLSVLLDGMRHGVGLYDRDGRLQMLNRLGAAVLGVPFEAAPIGETIEEVLTRQSRSGAFGPPDEAAREIGRILALDRSREHQYQRRQPDGRAIEVTSSPTADGGFVVTTTDVTDLVEARETAARQAGILAHVLETMRHSVALYDREGRLLAANRRSAEIWRRDGEVLPPRIHFDELIAEQAERGEFGDAEQTAAWLARLRGLDRSQPHRYLRTRPDGRTFEFVSEPTADGGFVVTGTDVTALLAAEAEARERARVLSVMQDSLRQGILMIGADGRVVLANRLAARLMGLDEEDLAPGADNAEIARKQAARGEFGDPEQTRRFLDSVRDLDRSVPQRYTRRRPDGTWLDVVSDPVPGGGFVVTLSDVTELFAAQEAAGAQAAMLRAMLENTRHGITLYDAEGRLLAANALAARLTGLPDDVLRPGRTLEEIRAIQRQAGEFGSGDRADRWYAGSMPGKAPRDERYVRERPDGTVLEVITRVLPGGGFVRSYTDITQLTRAEEQARREATTKRAMLENIRHGIAMFDATGRLIACNRIAADLVGLDPSDFVAGVHQDELIAKQAAMGEFGTGPEVAEGLARFRRDGFAIGRYVRRRPNGRFIEVTTQASPEGGFVRTYTDITEEREVRAELERARDAAEEASRAKSRFLATMTHELRTPLNAVIGFAQVLKGGARPEEATEYATLIEQAGRHLLGLIDDILDAARAETTRLPVEAEAVDLRALAAEALRFVGPQAADAGVELALTAPALPRVRGDAKRLRQVLLNLLGNAVKFSERGGRVTLDAEPAEDGALALRVTDQGIGIAPEDIPRAFQPFVQVENTLGRRFAGSGLGLYLARTLCEAMGMRLTLDSAPGVGTTATVLIPAERLAKPSETPEEPPA